MGIIKLHAQKPALTIDFTGIKQEIKTVMVATMTSDLTMKELVGSTD